MFFMLEFQKDQDTSFLHKSKKPHSGGGGGGANRVVGWVTERHKSIFPTGVAKAALGAGADRRPHIALTSAFFVLLLSSRGEDSRWSSGKTCREVSTSGRRRVHAHLSGYVRGIFVRYIPEAHFAPADRQ